MNQISYRRYANRKVKALKLYQDSPEKYGISREWLVGLSADPSRSGSELRKIYSKLIVLFSRDPAGASFDFEDDDEDPPMRRRVPPVER